MYLGPSFIYCRLVAINLVSDEVMFCPCRLPIIYFNMKCFPQFSHNSWWGQWMWYHSSPLVIWSKACVARTLWWKWIKATLLLSSTFPKSWIKFWAIVLSFYLFLLFLEVFLYCYLFLFLFIFLFVSSLF